MLINKSMIWELVILAVVYLIATLVLKPLARMRYYTRQGGESLGYFPILGYFFYCLTYIKKFDDIFHGFKQIGINFKAKRIDFAVSNIASQCVLYPININMVQEFFQKDSLYSRSEEGVQHIAVLFGSGIIVANGDAWKKRRRILSEMFRHQTIREMGTTYKQRSLQVINKMSQGGRLDVLQVAQTINVNNLMAYIFGEVPSSQSLIDEAVQDLNRLYPLMQSLITSPFYLLLNKNYFKLRFLPTAASLIQFSDSLKSKFNRLIDSIQSLHKEGRLERQSMISNYLNKVSRQDVARQQLVSDMIHLFLAGKDTTASVTSFCCYYISRYPQQAAPVFKEVLDLKEEDISPVLVQRELPLLSAFVFQVIRHCGFPGSLFNRVAEQDHELCGVHIKKGTNVNVLIATQYYNVDFFENPQEFRPSRFLEREREILSSFWFTPFGAGSRNCIGKNLALLSVKFFLVNLIRNFTFKIPESYKLQIGFVKTVSPVQPVVLELERRN